MPRYRNHRESAEFKARHAVAAIYTLSDPTRLASAFAQENNIRIVRRSEIETRLNKFSLNLFPELANPLEKKVSKVRRNDGQPWQILGLLNLRPHSMPRNYPNRIVG